MSAPMTEGFLIPRTSVEIPGGQTLSARGLSMPDIAWLARNCGPALTAAFARVRESGLDVDTNQLYSMLAGDMAIEGPLLAAHIIAAGVDLHDHVDTASHLAVSTQIELLNVIGEMTFAQGGGAKKVLETVIRVAAGIQGLTAPARQP